MEVYLTDEQQNELNEFEKNRTLNEYSDIGLKIMSLLYKMSSIDDYPTNWDGICLSSSLSFSIPFHVDSNFLWAIIGFEKYKDAGDLTLRLVLIPKYITEDLKMKDIPEVFIRLSDGTILTGDRSKTINEFSNKTYSITAYFVLNTRLLVKFFQNGGIKQVYISYVFSHLGIEQNKTFKAYVEDCDLDTDVAKRFSIANLLKQVMYADINKAKQEFQKQQLNSK